MSTNTSVYVKGFMNILRVFVLFSFMFGSHGYAENEISKLYSMSSSSILMLDANNHEVLSKDADRFFIPASTIKLLTALVALDKWGRNYRFKTEFHIDKKNNILIVKGLGDPFLISEELDVIVDTLKSLGLNQLHGIAVDSDYFSDEVNVSKTHKTNNPYDASLSALAVNFNTIEVQISSTGVVHSAESQTPITPMAMRLAKKLPPGRHRINLGNAKRAPEYFVQVLIAKLRMAGVEVLNDKCVENGSDSAELLLTHTNTRSLQTIVRAMLEYSNNFIANQLFLVMGAQEYGVPATFNKSQKMLNDYIVSQFDWQGHRIEEGAGLSRRNQLSARQLSDVLKKFEAYRDLMPEQNPSILAKSGTLKGVSCYAGYLYIGGEWQTFAMLVNQAVEYRFRERLAEQLLAYDG